MTADPRRALHRALGTMSGVTVPTAVGLGLGAAADLLLADPRRGHPVAGFGTAALALERRTWRDSRVAGAWASPSWPEPRWSRSPRTPPTRPSPRCSGAPSPASPGY